ncbi:MULTISPECIES: hypothetical protein [unclassified Streptomyces]|uniref:hypothetical protein n=1 Tax=unclassified Streptomyces TaxID=2593676 RepID=UPI0036E3BE94
MTTDRSGHSSAAVLPREDGTQPMVQTYQLGKDLYVYPEGASEAIAEGKVDEELFNVTGLIRQGYDDAHTDSLPLIATYRNSVDVARSAPAAPRGSERGLSLPAVDGVALKAGKDTAATFWRDITDTRSTCCLPAEEAVAGRQGRGHAGPFHRAGARAAGLGSRL